MSEVLIVMSVVVMLTSRKSYELSYLQMSESEEGVVSEVVLTPRLNLTSRVVVYALAPLSSPLSTENPDVTTAAAVGREGA